MFNQLFNQPDTIKRHFNAPLLEERMRYLTYRAEQGSKRSVLQEIASFQLSCIKYLPLEKGRVITLNKINSATNRWALYSMQHYRSKNLSSVPRKKRFIQHAIQWLSFLNRIEIPKQPPVPTQITEFIDYLRNEKGLAEVTILKIHQQLQNFFRRIKEDPSHFLDHLTPENLDALLAKIFHEGKYVRSYIQLYASRLRTFLRYAEARGWCTSRIADSIKTPRSYAHQTLPSSPSWEDVQRLLKNTEGNSPSNIRARAIILLLAVYGLRGSEVRQLQLEDIASTTVCIGPSWYGRPEASTIAIASAMIFLTPSPAPIGATEKLASMSIPQRYYRRCL